MQKLSTVNKMKKVTVLAAVRKHAIEGIKKYRGLIFTNNDIVDMLRDDKEFNKLLNMYDRKDDLTNLTSKTRWRETWERNVRVVFVQTKENKKFMLETHGIAFETKKSTRNGKVIRYWYSK